MGSDPVKTALFTGSQQFHTLWKRCEKHVRKHVKLNSSHVFSQFNSQVFHSIFTCFYPIVNTGSFFLLLVLLRTLYLGTRLILSFLSHAFYLSNIWTYALPEESFEQTSHSCKILHKPIGENTPKLFHTQVFHRNQAEVVCQFTANSPAANSTGWSCLPIRFKREIFTLFIRTNTRTVTFALNKVFQTRSAFLNDEYLLRDIAIVEYFIFIFI